MSPTRSSGQCVEGKWHETRVSKQEYKHTYARSEKMHVRVFVRRNRANATRTPHGEWNRGRRTWTQLPLNLRHAWWQTYERDTYVRSFVRQFGLDPWVSSISFAISFSNVRFRTDSGRWRIPAYERGRKNFLPECYSVLRWRASFTRVSGQHVRGIICPLLRTNDVRRGLLLHRAHLAERIVRRAPHNSLSTSVPKL